MGIVANTKYISSHGTFGDREMTIGLGPWTHNQPELAQNYIYYLVSICHHDDAPDLWVNFDLVIGYFPCPSMW